jgi:hypothetical protein
MESTYDDTLPLPDEVEQEFLDHAGGDVNAWFEQHDIAAAPMPAGKAGISITAMTDVQMRDRA